MMEEVFARNFEEPISVVAHKLLEGQRIGVHNDHLVGKESHRLVVQLNRGLSDDDGGILMLFNSDDPADISRVMRPVHVSGFAFEISPVVVPCSIQSAYGSSILANIFTTCAPRLACCPNIERESTVVSWASRISDDRFRF